MTIVSKNIYLAQKDIRALEESLEQLKDNDAPWARVQCRYLRELLDQAQARLARYTRTWEFGGAI